MNDTQQPRPLDGITVVSLEHAIAAPFCTRQLADLGARVIKVERPGSGDFARGYDERVSGLDFKSNIRWGAGQYGAFSSALGYTLVLSHYYKESEEAPTQDWRTSRTNYDWRSKVNASLTWDYQKATATLMGIRYGSVTNGAGDGRLSPWTVFNASARYKLNDRASVGLTVNNVLNQIKHDDSAGWPYYPTGNYDPYGRQWWLDVSYHFGG